MWVVVAREVCSSGVRALCGGHQCRRRRPAATPCSRGPSTAPRSRGARRSGCTAAPTRLAARPGPAPRRRTQAAPTAGGGENQLEMVEEVEEEVEQEVVVEWWWRWWRWWRARLASRALLHELDRRRLRPVVHVRVAGGLGVRVGQRLLEHGQRASVLNFHETAVVACDRVVRSAAPNEQVWKCNDLLLRARRTTQAVLQVSRRRRGGVDRCPTCARPRNPTRTTRPRRLKNPRPRTHASLEV